MGKRAKKASTKRTEVGTRSGDRASGGGGGSGAGGGSRGEPDQYGVAVEAVVHHTKDPRVFQRYVGAKLISPGARAVYSINYLVVLLEFGLVCLLFLGLVIGSLSPEAEAAVDGRATAVNATATAAPTLDEPNFTVPMVVAGAGIAFSVALATIPSVAVQRHRSRTGAGCSPLGAALGFLPVTPCLFPCVASRAGDRDVSARVAALDTLQAGQAIIFCVHLLVVALDVVVALSTATIGSDWADRAAMDVGDIGYGLALQAAAYLVVVAPIAAIVGGLALLPASRLCARGPTKVLVFVDRGEPGPGTTLSIGWIVTGSYDRRRPVALCLTRGHPPSRSKVQASIDRALAVARKRGKGMGKKQNFKKATTKKTKDAEEGRGSRHPLQVPLGAGLATYLSGNYGFDRLSDLAGGKKGKGKLTGRHRSASASSSSSSSSSTADRSSSSNLDGIVPAWSTTGGADRGLRYASVTLVVSAPAGRVPILFERDAARDISVSAAVLSGRQAAERTQATGLLGVPRSALANRTRVATRHSSAASMGRTGARGDVPLDVTALLASSSSSSASGSRRRRRERRRRRKSSGGRARSSGSSSASASVSSSSLSSLWGGFSEGDDADAMFARVRALIAGMNAAIDDAKRQDAALGQLAELAARDEDGAAAIVAHGGIDVILRAMGEHSEMASIQRRACVALYCLCIREAGRYRFVVEAAGLERILAVMAAFGRGERANLAAERLLRRMVAAEDHTYLMDHAGTMKGIMKELVKQSEFDDNHAFDARDQRLNNYQKDVAGTADARRRQQRGREWEFKNDTAFVGRDAKFTFGGV